MVISKIVVLLLIFFVFPGCFADGDGKIGKMPVRMKDYTTTEDDDYVCQIIEIKSPKIYVRSFVPYIENNHVHHMILFGCPGATTGVKRNCGSPCPRGGIMYAWANNAPNLTLPQDVSFEVGSETAVKSLGLQFHFKDAFSVPDNSGIDIIYTEKKTKYQAGILLYIPMDLTLPPAHIDYRVSFSCDLKMSQPIHIFAARVHAHGYSRANSAFYRKNDGEKWKKIVERSPQRPHAFYPVDPPVELKPGWKGAGRCVYDTTTATKEIGAGMTRVDEMCNIYLMFYEERTTDETFFYCSGYPVNRRTKNLDLPEPNSTEMAVPVADDHSHQHHHHHTGMQMPAETASTSTAPYVIDVEDDSDIFDVEPSKLAIATTAKPNVARVTPGHRHNDASSSSSGEARKTTKKKKGKTTKLPDFLKKPKGRMLMHKFQMPEAVDSDLRVVEQSSLYSGKYLVALMCVVTIAVILVFIFKFRKTFWRPKYTLVRNQRNKVYVDDDGDNDEDHLLDSRQLHG